MINTEAEAMLKHLGLTEYEAKAWLTLISHGSCTAEKISSLSGVPLPRVYDTMSALAERGFVIVTKTRPQAFRPTDPKRFFELLKEDEKRKVQEKIKKIEDVSPQFLRVISNIPKVREKETEEILAYVKRKVNMKKVREEFHSQAKNEILVFAGDISWIPRTASVIKKIIKRGIKYKIIWDKSTKDVIPNVRKALKLGVELRYFPNTGGLRCIIIDGSKVSLAQKALKPGVHLKKGAKLSEEVAEYTTITINNELVTDVFKRYFYSLWDKATPAEKFLKVKL